MLDIPRLQASKALPPKQDMLNQAAFSGNDLVVFGGCDLDLTSSRPAPRLCPSCWRESGKEAFALRRPGRNFEGGLACCAGMCTAALSLKTAVRSSHVSPPLAGLQAHPCVRRQRCQCGCTGNGQGWWQGLKQLRSAAGSVVSGFWALLRSGVLVPLVSNGAAGSDKVPDLARDLHFITKHPLKELNGSTGPYDHRAAAACFAFSRPCNTKPWQRDTSGTQVLA